MLAAFSASSWKARSRPRFALQSRLATLTIWEISGVLAERLESDEAFAAEFVSRPGLGDGLPRNIAMAAIKIRDIEG